MSDPARTGFAGRVTRAFIDNPVTPILMLIALIAGAAAIAIVPREEEPQIRAPLVDVLVPAPGLSARDAVEVITRPLEDILAGIEGVDHVYARTRDGRVVVSARFFTGTDSDDAVLRVIERIGANGERRPPGIPEPVIVGRGIEDVAVVTFALSPAAGAAGRYDHGDMWDLAEALRWRMTTIERVGLTYLVGAGATELRVEPDPDALARFGVPASRLASRLAAANRAFDGDALIAARGERVATRGGRGLADPSSVASIVVGLDSGRPVYLGDVADVVVGPPQPGALAWHLPRKGEAGFAQPRPAAVLAIAKRPGANGVEVAAAAREVLAKARDDILPADVEVTVTRDYGRSASANARALLVQLLGATVTIVLLIGLAVGLREAIVVGVIVPITILLTFFSLWLFGYTINRVSLFALIFAIGILVDDAIVVVENVTRHWTDRPPADRADARDSAVGAVDEVGNPTIISTLTIIAALLPMLAVGGLMGPYMAPIPANASAAVVFSTAVALTATPWLVLRLRRVGTPMPAAVRRRLPQEAGGGRPGGALGALYLRAARPILRTRGRSLALLLAVVIATLASFALFAFSLVTVKLLPFDDKREIQVVVDLPETAAVEETDRVLRAIADRLAPLETVESLQLYAGTSAPFNFNGLVRQYYLRAAPHLGDVKVNLVPVDERGRRSHAIALEIRERLAGLDAPEGTAVRIAEVPPGPPVFATLLAEIHGPDADARRDAAREVRAAFEAVDYVVDVDDTIGVRRERVRLVAEQAALERLGVSEAAVNRELRTLLAGRALEPTTDRAAPGDWPVAIELARADRGVLERLLAAPVETRDGPVELGQLVRVAREETDLPIFRRNGRDVVMVMATLAGAREAPIYGMLAAAERLDGTGIRIAYRGQPLFPDEPVLLWHGEWEITYTTFRDMGLAFLGAFLLIYAIAVAHFRRFKLPIVIMTPVPLTLLGVILGHWLIGAKFTATSMIGFIALAGIVVRNSVLLVEFVEARRAQGAAVREAVLEAGAVRFRPILLTAVTAMVGALFIMADPIFKGLAVSLFFGLISSTLLTTIVIPAIYVWRRAGHDEAG